MIRLMGPRIPLRYPVQFSRQSGRNGGDHPHTQWWLASQDLPPVVASAALEFLARVDGVVPVSNANGVQVVATLRYAGADKYPYVEVWVVSTESAIDAEVGAGVVDIEPVVTPDIVVVVVDVVAVADHEDCAVVGLLHDAAS